jgi:hypothetical protein
MPSTTRPLHDTTTLEARPRRPPARRTLPRVGWIALDLTAVAACLAYALQALT